MSPVCPRNSRPPWRSTAATSQGRRSWRRRSPISLWRRKVTKRVCSLAARFAASSPERSIAAPLCCARADALRDLGRAAGHRRDEARGIRGAARQFAGRGALFLDGARDRGEHRADRRDRRHDAVHRRDRFLRVALQLIDLAADLFGGVLGRARQRLDLLRHHREAAPGIARAHRLDGGVEREQIGLLGDRRNEADDIADLGRRGLQPVDALAGGGGRLAGIVGERAGVAHLAADLVGGFGEFFRGIGEVMGVLGRLRRHAGELPALRVDRAEHVGGRARAAAHRIGGALHVADHRGEIHFDEIDGLADRRKPRLRLIDGLVRNRGRRLDRGQGRIRVAAREPGQNGLEHGLICESDAGTGVAADFTSAERLPYG